MALLKPGAGEPCAVEPWVKPETLVSKSAHELSTTELRSDQICYISGCQSSHAWNVMIFCWGRGHKALLNWIWFIQVLVLCWSLNGPKMDQRETHASILVHISLPQLAPHKKTTTAILMQNIFLLKKYIFCLCLYFCLAFNKKVR